ncbi:MAG: hypothetical protein ABI634_12975 [Acidobacteriota bacterium]
MTGREPLRLTRADRDALAEFARAYLHEDTIAEHGSAQGAAAAFAADASADDRQHVARALEALIRAAEGRPLASLHRFLVRDIRCAWLPGSVDELTSVSRVIRGVPRT